MGGGLAATQAEVGRFSKVDAERLPDYYNMLESAASLLRDLALKIPPNATGGAASILAAIQQGRRFAKLPTLDQHHLIKLFTSSARELARSLVRERGTSEGRLWI